MDEGQVRSHVRVTPAFPEQHIDTADELGVVYERYSELLLDRCEATLGDPEVAADTLQDAFVAALTELAGGEAFTVRRLAQTARQMAYHRARQPRREVCAAAPSPATSAADPHEMVDNRALVHMVWGGLTATERECVRRAIDGYTLDEIGRSRRRAAGTIAAMLHQARRRARTMRDGLPAMVAVVRLRAGGALRRLRGRVQETASLAHGLVLSSSSEIAAAVIAALTLPAPVAALAAGAQAHAQATAIAAHGSSGAAAPAVDEPAHPGAPGTTRRAAPPRPPGRGGLALPAGLLAPPGAPEDTRLSAAAASPDYAHDHTVVALGLSPTCSCSALFRTTDGGATWQSSPQPAPSGSQLVLPPGFPADSRIFIGNVASSPVGDYVAPRFGAAFQQLTVPPGLIALSPRFDSGDARAFVAGEGALWSYDVGTGLARPEIVITDPTTPAFPVTVQGAVLALAPASSFATGGVVTAASGSNGGVPLYACPPDPTKPCSVRSRLPWPEPGWMAVDGTAAEAPVLLAGFGASLQASSDEGRSFRAVPLPPATQAVSTFGVATAGDIATVWLATAGRDGGHHIARTRLDDVAWADADGHELPDLAHAGALLVITPLRALYLMPDRGLRCTGDGGVTWNDRCAAAP